jgi:hypothetical protein
MNFVDTQINILYYPVNPQHIFNPGILRLAKVFYGGGARITVGK